MWHKIVNVVESILRVLSGFAETQGSLIVFLIAFYYYWNYQLVLAIFWILVAILVEIQSENARTARILRGTKLDGKR